MSLLPGPGQGLQLAWKPGWFIVVPDGAKGALAAGLWQFAHAVEPTGMWFDGIAMLAVKVVVELWHCVHSPVVGWLASTGVAASGCAPEIGGRTTILLVIPK